MTAEQRAEYHSLRKWNGLTAIIAYNWAVGKCCYKPLGNPIFRYHFGRNGVRCYSVDTVNKDHAKNNKIFGSL